MIAFFSKAISLWLCVLGLAHAQVPGNVVRRTRIGPGMSDVEVRHTIGRALHDARIQSRDTVYSMNRTYFAKSWVGATLFQYDDGTSSNNSDASMSTSLDSGIEITCATCYINGSVIGDLTLTGGYNFTQAVDEVKNDFSNFTAYALTQIENDIEAIVEDVYHDIKTFSLQDLTIWPTFNTTLNLANLTSLPGAQIHFEFDNLELYLDLDIKLSAGATYTLNLYSSETPAGIAVSGLTLGAVFSIDLILIADAEIDIGSGIHIKIDDGFAFDLEMFNSNVSTITMPGGAYEFLPVSIGGEGSIQALLSVKATLGVDINEKSSGDLGLDFSAGIETDVFAYVIDFLMKVNGSSATDSIFDCDLSAVAEYSVAVGAAAGATVAVDTSHSWGPSPNTTVPVWYTTLASICAASKTSSTASSLITPRAELNQREEVSTTALTSIVTYTIVNCMSSGLINCPVMYQNTTVHSNTVTSIVTVHSGSTTTFPTSIHLSVTSFIPFGLSARTLLATSGTPTSYIPPPTSTSESSGGTGATDSNGSGGSGILSGNTHGTSNKLIIGLSVGLGLPFLIALILGLGYLFRRRRQYSLVSRRENIVQGSPSTMHESPITPSTVEYIIVTAKS